MSYVILPEYESMACHAGISTLKEGLLPYVHPGHINGMSDGSLLIYVVALGAFMYPERFQTT